MKTIIISIFCSFFYNEEQAMRPVSKVLVYNCQRSLGYSTASATANFSELKHSCAYHQGLSEVNLTTLNRILISATSKKHHQKKIGKNLIFCEFVIDGNRHDFIISRPNYLLDLTERTEYIIESPQDLQEYTVILDLLY